MSAQSETSNARASGGGDSGDRSLDPPFGWGALAITLACFAVYAVSLPGGFVWDDDTHLLDNPVFGAGGLWGVWFQPPQVINYWPVTFTSYWIEHALWGFDPLGYRVVNVLLHAAASVVLWRVLARLRVPLAWGCALVFALHPVNVESVAWIAQRKNVLSLLFFVSATFFYLRFEVAERTRDYAAALGCHLLAMLSKGAAAPFPAILLLLAWWQRGTITRRDVLRSVAFFVITAATGLLELSTQDLVASDTIVRDDGFVARLVGAGWVAWFYLGKALAPIDLCFVYPRWEIDPSMALHWIPLIGVLGVLALLFVSPLQSKGWARPVQCALLFYALLLSPVLGFFDIYYMRYSFVADHYQYIALIGVVALVGGGVGDWAMRRWTAQKRVLLAVGAIAVVALGLSSAQLSRSYLGEERLWRDTLLKSPDAFLAHYNLAHLLERDGRGAEAEEHYRESLRIVPEYAEAMNNLGQLLRQRDANDEAEQLFRQAMVLTPDYAAPRNNLGVLLQQTDRKAEARRTFEAALAIAPENPVLYYNLARLLDEMGEPRTALGYYRRAAALAPESAAIQRGLRRAQASFPKGQSGRGLERR